MFMDTVIEILFFWLLLLQQIHQNQNMQAWKIRTVKYVEILFLPLLDRNMTWPKTGNHDWVLINILTSCKLIWAFCMNFIIFPSFPLQISPGLAAEAGGQSRDQTGVCSQVCHVWPFYQEKHWDTRFEWNHWWPMGGVQECLLSRVQCLTQVHIHTYTCECTDIHKHTIEREIFTVWHFG